MKNKYLTQEEKEYGLSAYMKHSAYNGLGFSFLASTTVYLMAIYYEASNLQLGYLSSVIYLSGIILIFLPKLLHGSNLVKVHYYAWIFRGLICSFYGFLFFVPRSYAVLLVLTVYTFFCLIRTIGIPVGQPIQQTLTNEENIGDFVAKLSNRAHSMHIVSNAISFIILSTRVLGTLPGLLLIQLLGIITNTLSAYYIKKVPCREVVEYKPGRNIFLLLKENLMNREGAMILLLHWLTLCSAILSALFIPFFRKIIMMPDNMIFLYTVIGSISAVCSGYLVKPFVDRIGSRPILILSSLCLALLTLSWMSIPLDMHWAFIFLLAFLTLFFQGMIVILTARLMLKMIPEQDKITYTSMVHFFSAIIALITGLFGGYLIDLGETLSFPYLHEYSLVFLMLGVFALGTGIVCYFLEDPGSLSVKETAQILLSTRNLRAYLDVYQFNITRDPVEKKSILLSIGHSDTHIATAEIRKILKNPLSTEKGELLKSLFERPREVLINEIIREANDGQSYHQENAIFALGAYPRQKVEENLIKLLNDPSPNIRSTTAKSLARVGNVSELAKVIELSKSPANKVWERMNFFIAVSLMDKSGNYLAELFDIAGKEGGASSAQTIFSLCSKLLKMSPPLSEIFQKENEKPLRGLRSFFNEARQLQIFNKERKNIQENFQKEDWDTIFKWCCSLLKEGDFGDYRMHLKYSIINQSPKTLNSTTILATLYFTFQLIRLSE